MLMDIVNDLNAKTHYEVDEFQIMVPQFRHHTVLMKFVNFEEAKAFRRRFFDDDEPVLGPDGTRVYAQFEQTPAEIKQSFYFRRTVDLVQSMYSQGLIAGTVEKDSSTCMIFLGAEPLLKIVQSLDESPPAVRFVKRHPQLEKASTPAFQTAYAAIPYN